MSTATEATKLRTPPKRVRVLVTGSRRWVDISLLNSVLDSMRDLHGPGLVIVHGACTQGADALADRWCTRNHVAVEPHPARWKLGLHAGLLRNQEMVDTMPDTCIAFIRDDSHGASHCVALARLAGIPTVVYRHDG